MEKENNAKAQSRREKDERAAIIVRRGMGILPMILTGGTPTCRGRAGPAPDGGRLFFSP